MEAVLGLLVVASFLAIFVGLFRPKWVMPWSESPRRLVAALFYVLATMVFMLLGGLMYGDPDGAASSDQTEELASNGSKPESTDGIAGEGAEHMDDAESSESSGEPEAERQEEESGPGDDRMPEGWRELDKSDEAQSDRRQFIDDLKGVGIVQRIETPTDYPRVYLGSGWERLTVQDKEQFINVVLTYHFADNPDSTTAVLRDAYTGEDVGTYSFDWGLRLD
ncbi:hypothetical protein [Aquisalimonas asiatica]|uniref:Uncharacterized protein n=1 Tax=Aquisalimonas asiatica TaxID=406100 RepID=A0A1H8RTG8_9GAMM|nr:hypothetical protein [Aquisalimonas asiatica]SEO69223.1 hypothetical protein SAMN04488052_102215 [Aquisalimonas asiatica]